MDWCELVDRLELHDEQAVHEEIHAIVADDLPLVDDRDLPLPLKRNAAQPQFDGQRFFVKRFQEAGAQVAMNLGEFRGHHT